MDVVVDALQEQPGWRSPRAIDEEAWRQCLRKLDVGPEELAGFVNMGVLPIRSGAEVRVVATHRAPYGSSRVLQGALSRIGWRRRNG